MSEHAPDPSKNDQTKASITFEQEEKIQAAFPKIATQEDQEAADAKEKAAAALAEHHDKKNAKKH